MKRILSSLLMVTMLLSCSVCAFADEIDLSQMSTDELLTLRTKLEQEIQLRTESISCEVFNGDYIVGEHIEPGRYILSIAEMVKSDSSGWVNVGLRNTNDSTKIESWIMIEGMSRVLDLSQGMTLRLDGVISATLEPVGVYAYTPERG